MTIASFSSDVAGVQGDDHIVCASARVYTGCLVIL